VSEQHIAPISNAKIPQNSLSSRGIMLVKGSRVVLKAASIGVLFMTLRCASISIGCSTDAASTFVRGWRAPSFYISTTAPRSALTKLITIATMSGAGENR
jgi:hypothetical protein